jgi:hypothetical protein
MDFLLELDEIQTFMVHDNISLVPPLVQYVKIYMEHENIYDIVTSTLKCLQYVIQSW